VHAQFDGGQLMGRQYAEGITETGLPLEDQLRWHLRSNHYPPVPEIMVPVCIEAISEATDENWDKLIEMPAGVSYRGESAAPVWAIVEQHHLETWINELGE